MSGDGSLESSRPRRIHRVDYHAPASGEWRYTRCGWLLPASFVRQGMAEVTCANCNRELRTGYHSK